MLREKMKDGTIKLSGARAFTALDIYPVGAVYFSATLVDPSELFGGTWARMAQGQVLVGVNESDTQFDAPLETGGAKTRSVAGHTHTTATASAGVTATTASTTPNTGTFARLTALGGGNHNHGATGTDGEFTIEVLQPFVTVYIWRRTA